MGKGSLMDNIVGGCFATRREFQNFHWAVLICLLLFIFEVKLQPKAAILKTNKLASVQILKQTTRHDGQTILTRDQLLLHTNILLRIAQLEVYSSGE